MIRPARVRSIRAYLGETQQVFGKRFDKDRYTVIHWEQYGIVDSPDLERLMLSLEATHDRPAREPKSGE